MGCIINNAIFDSLTALSSSVVCYRAKRLSEIPEFCELAKKLKIAEIVRTAKYDDDINITEIYRDAAFNGSYSKNFERLNESASFGYLIKSENCFDDTDKDTARVYDMLINIFCMAYSSNYLLEEEKLRRNIDKDSGIPNSDGYKLFCEKIIAGGKISDYAAVRADIKGCNLLNNIYGYHETTQILTKFASVLNSLMDSDEICARTGGDSFSLLLKKNKLKKHLREFAGTSVDFYIGHEKVVQNISMCAGIVQLDEEINNINMILARADSCLDIAKRKADSDIVFYNKDAIKREIELTLIESEMPAALDNHEFVVYYQPKVCVDNRTMIGAEALIRWKKNGRLISPMDFIPIAERTGFIKRLDLYVLEHTCRIIRRWISEDKLIVPISVNFSKMHLRFPHFADKIMKIIDKYEIPPHYIEIEFTETAYNDDFNAIKQAIDDLKSHGVTVSMDDFGTGYSSLALLKDLDFDILKLDKSLANNKSDAKGLVVLENILRMARQLNMITVCEGIEEKENVESLHSMGCNIIQGYYFDRPLPEDEFADRLLNPVYQK